MFRIAPTAALFTLFTCAAFTANAASLKTTGTDWSDRFAPISAHTTLLVPLKNGFTLHEYQDGKMAVENQFGRPVLVKPGQMLTRADGKSVRMVGDEVARLTAEMQANNHR